MMSAVKLYESEPKDLAQDQLHILYAGLLSKLAVTCEEMIGRNEEYAHLLGDWLQTDLARHLSRTERTRGKIGVQNFKQSAEHMRSLYVTLKIELTRLNERQLS
jgi:hypothetical protein